MIEPLNSPLEVGLRTLFILADQYPSAINLDTLTVLDYYLLHSGEYDGPASTFPDLPNSISEFGLKRGLIQDGLHLMQSVDLVAPKLSPAGIEFQATENTAGFLDLLTEDLAATFRNTAQWISATVVPALEANAGTYVQEILEDWRIALRSPDRISGGG